MPIRWLFAGTQNAGPVLDPEAPTGNKLNLRILLVQTWYPEFLTDLYNRQPELAGLPFAEQQRRLFGTAFGISDAYSHGLRSAGWEAEEVICNADLAQAQWAREHDLTLEGNIHDRRRRIVSAQVVHHRPDVLYVFEWSPLGDAFLDDMRSRVRLLAGQIASPLPANRTFTAYDLMLSSWPPIVDYFLGEGKEAAYLRLGFDDRILQHWKTPLGPVATGDLKYNVTFVGGFAPSHRNRIGWLEELLRHRPMDIFAYGIDTLPPNSPIRLHCRGEAWGLTMYQVLRASKVTVNLHAEIDVRGHISHRFANNMRLFEATGAGVCLLTEDRDNLGDMFEAGEELFACKSPKDAARIIDELLADDSRRSAVAKAGQNRTLQEHTYQHRMQELSQILVSSLHSGRNDAIGAVGRD